MSKLIPIFVGGTGRSGTTVFKGLLSRHAKVATIQRELRLTIDPGGALDLVSSLSDRWSPAMADAALTRFDQLVRELGGDGVQRKIFSRIERSFLWPKGLSPARYSGWNLARSFGAEFYGQRLERLTRDLSHASSQGRWLGSEPYRFGTEIRETFPFVKEKVMEMVSECFDDLYRQLPNNGVSATHWLDDSPYNLVYARELLSTFEGSRFIHLYRDPRDVLASYQTKIWGGNDFEVIAQRLGGLYERWFQIRETLPEDSVHEVALEELVADPEGVLTRVCEFAGMEFDSELLGFPLDKANTGRWKKDIAANEIGRALPHLAQALDVYEYSDRAD